MLNALRKLLAAFALRTTDRLIVFFALVHIGCTAWRAARLTKDPDFTARYLRDVLRCDG